MFKLGYNTNGFGCHSLLSAIDIISNLGYESVAITIDHHSLNPAAPCLDQQVDQVRKKLVSAGLSSVIETGARFLLNPEAKHEPTLISVEPSQRRTRIEFIETCFEIASRLGSDAVSIWSGKKPDAVADKTAMGWLVEGCRDLAQTARKKNIPLAFEPEPGMMIENMAQYRELKQQVDSDDFRLTLDLGHALITEKNVCDTLVQFRDDIVNIHLEDMKKEAHHHLMFGQGEMDFSAIFSTLQSIQYNGQVNVELSRHSHDAVNTARSAIAFLRAL